MTTPLEYRNRFREIAYRARSLPGQYGLRQYTVEVGISSYSGAHTGDLIETQTFNLITELGGFAPKVRWLKSEEIALGNLPAGTVRVGPFTPDFPGGGTSFSLLAGNAIATGAVLAVRLTGLRSGPSTYRVVVIDDDSALHYTLTCSPVSAV